MNGEPRFVRETTRAIRRIGGKLVVGCSGGADSTALLVIASRSGAEVVAAHVNHGLHAEADAAEALVATLAARLGVPFARRALDPDALQTAAGGLEAAARDSRYSALGDICRELGAGTLLTAHTASDRLETMVMRLSQGCGLRALDGPQPVIELGGVRVMRPLLSVWRPELNAFLAQEGISAFEDPTNADEGRLRNLLRRRVAAPWSDAVSRDALAASLENLARDASLFRSLLAGAARDCIRSARNDEIVLDRERVAAAPEVLRTALLRDATAMLGGGRATRVFLESLSRAIVAAGDREIEGHRLHASVSGRIVIVRVVEPSASHRRRRRALHPGD